MGQVVQIATVGKFLIGEKSYREDEVSLPPLVNNQEWMGESSKGNVPYPGWAESVTFMNSG